MSIIIDTLFSESFMPSLFSAAAVTGTSSLSISDDESAVAGMIIPLTTTISTGTGLDRNEDAIRRLDDTYAYVESLSEEELLELEQILDNHDLEGLEVERSNEKIKVYGKK